MNKIGFLSVFNFGSSIGGVENHVYFLSRELVKRGHEVIVFQPCAEDRSEDAEEELTPDGVRVVKIFIGRSRFSSFLVGRSGAGILGLAAAFLNKARFFGGRRKIAGVIARFGCDLVHQHDFISSVAVTKRLSRQGVLCVLTNHTGEYLFLKRTLLGRFLLSQLTNHFALAIGPSKELTPFEYVSNSITIHNGVDPEIFHPVSSPDRAALRAEFGVGEGDFVVLCPRRWAPTKGVVYLAQAIAGGSSVRPLKFMFAGSDYPAYPRYAQAIRAVLDSASPARYRLLGNLSVGQMANAYRAADVVVIPSLMEAVSLSAVEAMACGAVVVSTDVGGMPELIVDGRDGLLISPRSPDAISDAVARLHDDRLLLSRLGEAAMLKAKAYSWSSIAAKTEAAYASIGNS